MPLLLIFGIFDLLVGVALILSPFVPFEGNGFVFSLGLMAIIKGLYSYLAAAASGFYFDVLGALDLALGLCLVLTVYGMVFDFFLWIGAFMIIKALYTIVIFLIR